MSNFHSKITIQNWTSLLVNAVCLFTEEKIRYNFKSRIRIQKLDLQFFIGRIQIRTSIFERVGSSYGSALFSRIWLRSGAKRKKNSPVCSRAVDSPVISAVHIAVQIAVQVAVVGSSLAQAHQTLQQIGCCCCLLCCLVFVLPNSAANWCCCCYLPHFSNAYLFR